MTENLFEKHNNLKEAIGAFMLAFSQLEFGLGILGTFTEFDLIRRDEHLPYYLGMTLENKKKALTDYLNKYEKELIPTWTEIKKEVDFLNSQRRFIAHGIQHVFVDDKLTAVVKMGEQLQEKELTIDDVKSWTERLHNVNSGNKGILGVFYQEFVTRSVNRWNRYVIDDLKIVYRVNDEIMSKWKGK